MHTKHSMKLSLHAKMQANPMTTLVSILGGYEPSIHGMSLQHFRYSHLTVSSLNMSKWPCFVHHWCCCSPVHVKLQNILMHTDCQTHSLTKTMPGRPKQAKQLKPSKYVYVKTLYIFKSACKKPNTTICVFSINNSHTWLA